MISKWVHYKLHCMVCKTPIGATVRRRHEPEVEHLCFTCPDPGTPEPMGLDRILADDPLGLLGGDA